MSIGEKTSVVITAPYEQAVLKKILRNFLTSNAVYYKLGSPCMKGFFIAQEDAAFEAQ